MREAHEQCAGARRMEEEGEEVRTSTDMSTDERNARTRGRNVGHMHGGKEVQEWPRR